MRASLNQRKLKCLFFFDDTKTVLDCKTAGGKAVNLQKLGKIDGIHIPRWSVVTTDVFAKYLTENGIFADCVQKIVQKGHVHPYA